MKCLMNSFHVRDFNTNKKYKTSYSKLLEKNLNNYFLLLISKNHVIKYIFEHVTPAKNKQ